MRSVLYRFYKLLTRREKWLACVVIGFFCATSVAEVFSLGMIFVYVKLIMEPAALEAMEPLVQLQHWLGITERRVFLIVLGQGLVLLLLVKTMVGLAAVWASMRFAMGRMAAFSSDLFRIYLFKNYTYFIDHHAATLKKNILEEVFVTIQYVLIPVLTVISELIVLSCIVALLVVLHPVQTAIMFVVTAGLFGLYLLCARGPLDRLSHQKDESNAQRHRLANDAFNAIKESILWNARPAYANRFREVLERYAFAMTWSHVLVQVPRFFIETIAFILVVGLIMYYLQTAERPEQVISVIALYGAAGMRMLPSFNRIVGNLSQIRFSKGALFSFYEDLILRRYLRAMPPEASQMPEPLPFHKTIAFDNVSFAYVEGGRDAVDGVSLTVPKSQTVAFVGSSGAGKSTLVELLLGLIEPRKGRILIDGVALSPANMERWRAQIGYIPQRVFLLDATVAENIAFGTPPELIDRERVRWACQIAHIDTFIERDLVQGYDTPVGEHGARLSGGQAQRIAIARALYRKPSLLIMDEATAALDGITEREISETLDSLSGQLTILIIAHRLNTVRNADRIYMLHKGEVADSGTYDELLKRSAKFREMAGGG